MNQQGNQNGLDGHVTAIVPFLALLEIGPFAGALLSVLLFFSSNKPRFTTGNYTRQHHGEIHHTALEVNAATGILQLGHRKV
jgi:hypothetical protein